MSGTSWFTVTAGRLNCLCNLLSFSRQILIPCPVVNTKLARPMLKRTLLSFLPCRSIPPIPVSTHFPQGLSRLVDLLYEWFNLTLGEKLLDHLKRWLDPEKLLVGVMWKDGESGNPDMNCFTVG